MSVAIEVAGLQHQYATRGGQVSAINGVDLGIEAGSSVAIMGPSGCGKSTLLGIIGGLERPTRGRVTVMGVPVSELGDEGRARFRRENIGFIFQAYDLLPFLTVLENVRLQVAISGRSGNADPAVLLDQLGLGGQADKLPEQLSGGQKQRVGIARCLAHGPRVILADEPTGELDSVTSESVITALLEGGAAIGSTAVVVTHDASVAAHFPRTLRMADGKLV